MNTLYILLGLFSGVSFIIYGSLLLISPKMQNEFKRSKRYNHPCSLIMADIDHFKKINDTYGHQFGDHVLYNTAKIIKASCRSTDIPARYGGEEFCIILPETGRQNAMIVANPRTSTLPKRAFMMMFVP